MSTASRAWAHEHPDRGRTEPQALLDHAIQERQMPDVLTGGASRSEHAVHLRAQALRPERVRLLCWPLLHAGSPRQGRMLSVLSVIDSLSFIPLARPAVLRR